MDNTNPDFLFLQNLYQQDTLYLVPEENPLASLPLPPTAALVDIEKPHFLAEDSSTFEEEDKEAPVSVATEPDVAWLGQALKGTYLLFHVPDSEFSQLPENQFLGKILAAVGLATLEVKFGNLASHKIHNIKEIAQSVKAKHILVFGETLPVENLLKLEPYRMYKLDETRFVRVHDVAAIEQSKELKGKLWEVLQKIFLQ